MSQKKDYVHLEDRWQYIERPYIKEEVLSLRGTKRIEHTLARDGALKLWGLLNEKEAVRSLGALTGNQAVQQVLNSNQKTILLVIYNSQNQRRYIGIKLD